MPSRASTTGIKAPWSAMGSICSLLRKRERRLSRWSRSCCGAAVRRVAGRGNVLASVVRHKLRRVSSATTSHVQFTAWVARRKGQTALTSGSSRAYDAIEASGRIGLSNRQPTRGFSVCPPTTVLGEDPKLGMRQGLGVYCNAKSLLDLPLQLSDRQILRAQELIESGVDCDAHGPRPIISVYTSLYSA